MSLLVLLASVFFSGFVLTVSNFSVPVQVVAYALPVTHGIQDQMLRGATDQAWSYIALAGIAAGTLTITWLLLRRHDARLTDPYVPNLRKERTMRSTDGRPLDPEIEIDPATPAPEGEIETEHERLDRDDERAKRDDPISRIKHALFEEGPASPMAADIEEPEERL